jgi:hypothetical protein
MMVELNPSTYTCTKHAGTDLTERVWAKVAKEVPAGVIEVLGAAQVASQNGTKPFVVLVTCDGDATDPKPHKEPFAGEVTY